MLEAQGVTVRVGTKTLLEAVDARLRPGELLALLGPNGAGKSTLLKVLSAATGPGAGSVRLEGRPLSQWPNRLLARRRAVLPQESFRGGFAFTARELVLLGRAPHQGDRDALPDEEVALAALEASGAAELAERDLATLSGGEFQRVELARVLAQVWEARPPRPPGYLLLDEPTASLDLVQQGRTLALARDLARQGYGVLAIVHDLTAALELADSALLLSEGRVMASGPVERVMQPEVLSRAYGAPLERRRLEGSQRMAIVPAATGGA